MNFKIRSFLFKKRKQLKRIPKQLFQEIFWESNPDNLYYGHYHILKSYSKTILPYKINGEVQHGWSPDHGIPSNPFHHNKIQKQKRYYLINKNNEEKSIRFGYKNLVVMGAPFIYLPNIFHKNNLEAKKSIIFFPLHTHENDYAGNPHSSYKLYLIELKKIIRFFNTISVSLGWREYKNENIVNMFKDEGFNVVTMGPRDNNPFFLKNFVKIVGHHEYVSSDSFSSAIFYSLVMKKKVFLYGKPLSKGERINFKGKLINYNAFYYERYPELLWENFNHKSHFEIGQEELGCDYKLNPKSLREIFGWKIKNIF